MKGTRVPAIIFILIRLVAPVFVQLGLQVIKAIILVLGVRSSTNNKAQEMKKVYIVRGIAKITTFTRRETRAKKEHHFL